MAVDRMRAARWFTGTPGGWGSLGLEARRLKKTRPRTTIDYNQPGDVRAILAEAASHFLAQDDITESGSAWGRSMLLKFSSER